MKPGAELAPAREAQGYSQSRLPSDVGQPDCAHFDRWARTPSHLEGDRASEGDFWRDCAFESETAAHQVSTHAVPDRPSKAAPGTSDSASFSWPETATAAAVDGSTDSLKKSGARALSRVAAEVQPTNSAAPAASDFLGDQPVHGSDLIMLERVGALQGKRRYAASVHG